MAKIYRIEDVNAKSLARLFAEHYEGAFESVEVTDAGAFGQLSGVNDNYNSEIKTTSVSLSMKDKETGEEKRETAHLVFKTPVKSSFLRSMQKIGRPMSKEIVWYTKAWPMMAAKFPAMKEIAPICYRGYSNFIADDDERFDLKENFCDRHCCLLCWFPFRPKEAGILILENASLNNAEKPFKTIDKSRVPSLEHVKLALKTIAHFHGSWWKFFNDSDGTFKDAPMSKTEALKMFNDTIPTILYKDMILKSFKSVERLLRNRNEDEEMIARFREYGKSKAIDKVKGVLCDSSHDPSKLLTICHGDFWSNNMLFHEDKQVKLIDFQMLNYAHPARDLGYFLFITTDHLFREKHLDECIRTYFDVFGGYLDPKLDVTFEKFNEEFRDRMDGGFVLGILVMPNVLSPNQRQLETMADFRAMDRHRNEDIASPDKDDDHEGLKVIRNRLVGMVQEFDKLGRF